MASRLNKQQRMDRDAKAVQLRLAGTEYDAIAKTLGYANKSHAWKAVDGVLRTQQREAGDALLNAELSRLDMMQRSLFTRALQGDEKAVGVVLRVMDHRAKITGLYEVQPQSNDDAIRSALAGFLAGAQAQHATILQASTEADATIERPAS